MMRVWLISLKLRVPTHYFKKINKPIEKCAKDIVQREINKLVLNL